ncbi:DUF72 domain-containing protein [Streptomyces pristinaespiralis]|uniref:Histidine kinase n=1 Tax=Streptomyces pristinaespiralis TaxID=38300 RepID=A0A0M4DJT6_STRPR|nr:DUF72 domain-containing protein [Streptomyces pristinaespiralis]ALC21967.1 histidine kinase [Streptomyces pristinaespiralis]QMU15374.1 DUF72 domain-containing protein [Streptomyces pristinaespiralis]
MPMLVGTSGWQYKDWRGVLYPPGLPQRLWLEEYAARFATVENNNAFYRLPTTEVFRSWRERTPDGFVMAVKASRFLTHLKRLREPEEPVHRLLDRTAGLGDRMGPVLLQLPATFHEDVDALDACLRCFPATVRVAVELRHISWWQAETRLRALLERHGSALCWADRGSRPVTPLWRTASWGYVRFHAGLAQPPPRYGHAALKSWVGRITGAWPDEDDVYVYFNNDTGGAAVVDAARFARSATAAGRTVSRTPRSPGGTRP